ncbi:hypothetical protein [Pseudomaricurvus sp.]|uniref:hypothetical protein n=1 Tax=Pseudomaricurvus sp. TaxID=2004510 RepID=UPI003F6A7B89
MAGSSTLYITLLAEFSVVSVLICGWLAWGLRRYRRSYRELLDRYKTLYRERSRGAEQEFLKRQLVETQKRSQQQSSQPGLSVWQLRQYMLRCEADALALGESSEAYWQELERRLERVTSALRLVRQEEVVEVGADSEEPPSAGIATLEPEIEERSVKSLLAVIERQRELIDYLRNHAAEPDEQGGPALSSVGGGISAMDAQLQRSEERVWGVRDSMRELQSDLRIIHQGAVGDQGWSRDYEQTQQEADALQETIHYQQETIDSFSQELGRLRTELLTSMPGEEADRQHQHIARLERLLKETEGCVQVLESELNELRERLLSMSSPPLDTNMIPEEESVEHNIDRAAESDVSVALQQELEQLRDMLDSSLIDSEVQSSVISFAISCSRCRDLNELGSEVVKALANLGMSAAVLIRSGGKQIELYDHNHINQADRKQLKALVPAVNAQVVTLDQGYGLAGPALSLLAKPEDVMDQHVLPHMQELLFSFSALISAFVAKLEAQVQHQQQAQTLQRVMDRTSKTIKALDVQYKYQAKEVTSAVGLLLKQLEEGLHPLDIEERQRRILQYIIDDFRSRMTLLFRTGLSIDKALADLKSSVDAES